MEQNAHVVSAKHRSANGKGPARRLRAEGLIPAVVYGKGAQPSSIAVDPEAIMEAIANPHRFNTLITLKLDDSEKRVLFKDYQVDPVSRELLHADFFEVAMDKPVKVEVPVMTVGRAEGVLEGGILQVNAHQIVVEAMPDQIPVQIEVDVTSLKIGQSIHIAEVKAPAGCTIKYATNYTVAVVAVPEKEEVVAAPVAAVVPGAEGAVPVAGAAPGAPGAPGAAPGAPGAAPGAPGAAPAAGGAPGAAPAPAKAADAKGGKGKRDR